MNFPEFYDQNSDLQKSDAAEFIPYLISKMSWKAGETILDFGCGSGFVTKEILLSEMDNVFPDESRKVYGVDISKKMTEYACAHYSHRNLSYISCDITSNQISLPCFDKIFSFYVLHWVDQRKVFQSLYNLMKPQAELAFYFASKSHVFYLWEVMAKYPAWKSYYQLVENSIPKSTQSSEPASDISLILKSTGFLIHESVQFKQSYYYKTWEEFLGFALALDPVVALIPLSSRQNYIDDLRKELKNFYKFAPTVELPFRVKTEAELVLVRAMKS